MRSCYGFLTNDSLIAASVIERDLRAIASGDQDFARLEDDSINLSISAPVRSYYWDDPLNQAVMAAWQAGIVVVASAGNNGTAGAMSVGAPGNVPYVIRRTPWPTASSSRARG